MPEAVIVSAARSPIGRAFKGSLKDLRPDDLTATIVRAALDKVPELDPHRHRRPATSAAACPAGRAASTWARIVARAARLRPPARRDDHPLLLLVAADHPDGLPRDQGRRGRRVHLRGRRDGLPVREGQLRQPPGHRRTRSSPRPRRAPTELGAGRRRTGTDPREDGARPGRLHRDGPDGGERRPAARAVAPGARRVRGAQPEPRREGDRRRLLGQRRSPR